MGEGCSESADELCVASTLVMMLAVVLKAQKKCRETVDGDGERSAHAARSSRWIAIGGGDRTPPAVTLRIAMDAGNPGAAAGDRRETHTRMHVLTTDKKGGHASQAYTARGAAYI